MKKEWLIVSVISVIILACFALLFIFYKPAGNIVKKITTRVGLRKREKCPIDGLPTNIISIKERKPLAVMIENLASIRPQNGLSKACIVFEALAEGGITRFVAVFNHNEVSKIGPVRSARPYYVALATGFDAVYAHAGGSKVGLEKVKEYGVDDFDQFRYAGSYWRQSGINAPHNLFTSTEKIRAGSTKAGFSNVSYTGYKFSNKKLKGLKARNIKINFSSSDYEVRYKYDFKKDKYKRYNGAVAHLDANNNKQIVPSNIVVVRADTSMYDVQTLNIAIIGKGSGYFFRNGVQTNIKWKKSSAASQIRFLDDAGKEVKFKPGQIWVEVVRPGTKVNYN